jgi:hypothetical protein
MTHSLIVFRIIHIQNGEYVLKYWLYTKILFRQSIQVWKLKVLSTYYYLCLKSQFKTRDKGGKLIGGRLTFMKSPDLPVIVLCTCRLGYVPYGLRVGIPSL